MGVAERCYGSAYEAPGGRTGAEGVEHTQHGGADPAALSGLAHEFGARQFGGGVVAYRPRLVSFARRRPVLWRAVLCCRPEVDQVRRRARRQYRHEFSDHTDVEPLHLFWGALGGANAVDHGHGAQSLEEVAERLLWLLDEVEPGPLARGGEPALVSTYLIDENAFAGLVVARDQASDVVPDPARRPQDEDAGAPRVAISHAGGVR